MCVAQIRISHKEASQVTTLPGKKVKKKKKHVYIYPASGQVFGGVETSYTDTLVFWASPAVVASDPQRTAARDRSVEKRGERT